MNNIILINAGTQTRKAFTAGLTHASCQHIKSKDIIAHIGARGPIQFVANNNPIDFTDSYVFTRLRANDQLFCGILYEHLEALGIPTSDPVTLYYPHAEEKIAQMARLVRAGLTIAETIIAREEGFEKNRSYIEAHFSFPLVYKLDGSRGRNVHLVQSAAELEALLREKPAHQRFMLQKLVPNTFDTRTLVAYGEILGSISRTALPGQFHNNVAMGAAVAAYTLDDEAAAAAIKATSAAMLDFGGVDLIHTADGPVVLEVNKSPQIAGFERVHGKGIVFGTIARLLEAK